MKLKPLFLIGLLLCFFIFSVLALPLENFGDWTENNDPENKLVLSGANNESIIWTQVNRSDSCYYELNRTEPDFNVWFEFNVTAAEAGDVDSRNYLDLYQANTAGGHLGGHYFHIRLKESANNDAVYYISIRKVHTGVIFLATSAGTINVGDYVYVNVTQYWNSTHTIYTCDMYSTANLRETGGDGNLIHLNGTTLFHDIYHYFLVVIGLNSGVDAGDWTSGIISDYDFAPGPEAVEPQYHYPFGLNSTLNGSVCQFTVNFTDNAALSHGLLSWNNSGTWANVSYTLTGTVDLALWNQTLNATSGLRIEYLFYVNDTSNNWNTTLQHFIYTNTKPIVLVISDAGVLFIGFIVVFALLGGIFVLGRRKR